MSVIVKYLTRIASTFFETGTHENIGNIFLSAGLQEHVLAFLVADDRNSYLK
jgi:hypothetical protein